jgi:hypothetical protein
MNGKEQYYSGEKSRRMNHNKPESPPTGEVKFSNNALEWKANQERN